MICLGYDYGTTNSLVASFVGDGSGAIRLLARKPSSSGMDASPKRKLALSDFDAGEETLIRNGIYGFSRKIFSDVASTLGVSRTEEPVFLTVTIPNAFRGRQCKVELETVSQAGQAVFGDNRLPLARIALLPEPVAAALYYVYLQLQSGAASSQGVLTVCDIGGGTTDLAAVWYHISDQDGTRNISFRVMSTEGDPQLGGEDIDRLLVDYFKTDSNFPRFYSEEGLLAACRALKRRLSSAWLDEEVTVALPGPDLREQAVDDEGSPFSLKMNRAAFERLLAEYQENGFWQRLAAKADSLDEAYREEASRLNTDNGSVFPESLTGCTILPVGGSSQIPALREFMRRKFNGELFIMPGEDKLSPAIPFDSVARGAAVYSAWMAGSMDQIGSICIEQRTLHRISICVDKDGCQRLYPIVERNMPSQRWELQKRLIPLRDDHDGTFRLERILLYEGEGDFVGDTRYGKAPTPFRLLSDLNDKICLHGHSLNEVPIQLELEIEDGRPTCLWVMVAGGCENGDDYVKPLKIV